MVTYDDYFTNEDKPFAENLNDALLLSNVFDMTVPIQIPKMFGNSTWENNLLERKAGVSIIKLKDNLSTGLSIDTLDGESVITGTGTIQLLVYPNFNRFGKFKAISWDSLNNNIQVNLKTKEGVIISSNINKGNLVEVPPQLQVLDQIIIELVFLADDTLKSLNFIMVSKQQKYGAECIVEECNGLQEALNTKINKTDIINGFVNNNMKVLSANQGKVLQDSKVDKETGKGLSTNDFTNMYETAIEKNNWVKVNTRSENITLYCNPLFRVVDFRFYRTEAYIDWEETSLDVCTESYGTLLSPKMETPLASYNVKIKGIVKPINGGFIVCGFVDSEEIIPRTLNFRGMWHY